MKTDKLTELRKLAKTEEPAAIAGKLAMLFPELRDAPLEPFVPEKLDRWAMKELRAQKSAARYVLSFWSGHKSSSVWLVGAFTLEDIENLSLDSREIIQCWMNNPFWI